MKGRHFLATFLFLWFSTPAASASSSNESSFEESLAARNYIQTIQRLNETISNLYRDQFHRLKHSLSFSGSPSPNESTFQRPRSKSEDGSTKKSKFRLLTRTVASIKTRLGITSESGRDEHSANRHPVHVTAALAGLRESIHEIDDLLGTYGDTDRIGHGLTILRENLSHLEAQWWQVDDQVLDAEPLIGRLSDGGTNLRIDVREVDHPEDAMDAGMTTDSRLSTALRNTREFLRTARDDFQPIHEQNIAAVEVYSTAVRIQLFSAIKRELGEVFWPAQGITAAECFTLKPSPNTQIAMGVLESIEKLSSMILGPVSPPFALGMHFAAFAIHHLDSEAKVEQSKRLLRWVNREGFEAGAALLFERVLTRGLYAFIADQAPALIRERVPAAEFGDMLGQGFARAFVSMLNRRMETVDDVTFAGHVTYRHSDGIAFAKDLVETARIMDAPAKLPDTISWDSITKLMALAMDPTLQTKPAIHPGIDL